MENENVSFKKTTMHVSKFFVNFIRNRVGTAANGTFGVFKKVVDREEIDHLYQVFWNPKVKLNRLGKSLVTLRPHPMVFVRILPLKHG